MNWENKRVLVVGMARSGIAVASLLLEQHAIPLLYDSKKESTFGDALNFLKNTSCEFHLGEDINKLISSVSCMIISPGVPIDAPFVVLAKELGVSVIGELEFAYSLLKSQTIAITGTNGKTTTTTLTGEIFKNAGRTTHVAGNIGYPLSAVSLLAKKEDISIIEVSSFQLESIYTFRPYIAALLNITPDHLNRHGNMETYISLKQRIFENQTPNQYSVLNYDDLSIAPLAKNIKSQIVYFSRTQTLEQGAYLENGEIVWKWKGITKSICKPDEILIPGPHNLENALAAIAIACIMGIPSSIIRHTLITFTGVEHRIERVRTLNNITYINDSKATNVDSTIKALESMQSPTVLILGGYDKRVDFSKLCEKISTEKNIIHVVVLGETALQLQTQLSQAGVTYVSLAYSLQDAIKKSQLQIKEGGNILLSPACASFDMFDDYEHRGKVFKQLVNEL